MLALPFPMQGCDGPVEEVTKVGDAWVVSLLPHGPPLMSSGRGRSRYVTRSPNDSALYRA